MTKPNILFGEKLIITCNDCSEIFLKSSDMLLHKKHTKCNNFHKINAKYYCYNTINNTTQIIQCYECGKYFGHNLFFLNHSISNQCKIKLKQNQLLTIKYQNKIWNLKSLILKIF